jgi:hypothetical protein
VSVTSVTLPVLPAIVPAARRMVRAIMDGAPRAHDVEVVASEMITCVLVRPLGDEFTLILRTETGRARVEVCEAATGGHRVPSHGCPDAEYVQWPQIMDALTDKWGTYGAMTPDGRAETRGTWAEIAWPCPAPQSLPESRRVSSEDTGPFPTRAQRATASPSPGSSPGRSLRRAGRETGYHRACAGHNVPLLRGQRSRIEGSWAACDYEPGQNQPCRNIEGSGHARPRGWRA